MRNLRGWNEVRIEGRVVGQFHIGRHYFHLAAGFSDYFVYVAKLTMHNVLRLLGLVFAN